MFSRPSDAERSIDLSALNNKVVLVTGANSGLGRQAVIDMARDGSPACLWVAARSLDKAKAAAEEIQALVPGARLKPVAMDLTSLASVRAAAAHILQESPRLDVLMLNAGIMAHGPALTDDGYEVQMAVNHLAHAHLAHLLLPLLLKTARLPGASVRLVSLSSHGHTLVSEKTGLRLDLAVTKAEELGPLGRYAQSKLACILWIRHFAAVHREITAVAVHPGVVATNLLNNASAAPWIVRVAAQKLFGGLLTGLAKGVRNQLWAATSSQVASGEYYEPVGVGGRASKLATDQELAERVYEWTREQLSGH